MKFEAYNKLSKDEKRKLKEDYANTKKGIDMNKRFNRITFYSVFSFAVAIITLVLEITKQIKWWYCFFTIGLVIMGFFFALGVSYLKKTQYSIFLAKRK